MVGGSHSETNASTAYCANDKQMIAICDGFSTNVDTHENRNAGAAPNASIKYAHSAPEDVFIVPSSAYASAPVSHGSTQKNQREKMRENVINNVEKFAYEYRKMDKITLFPPSNIE